MSTFDPKSFGRKLRAAREELELTQAELSIRSANPDDATDRISTPYISALERGERPSRPSEAYLDAIARGLHHQDPWLVREWAGIERKPGVSTVSTIRKDDALSPRDRTRLIDLYERLVSQP